MELVGLQEMRVQYYVGLRIFVFGFYVYTPCLFVQSMWLPLLMTIRCQTPSRSSEMSWSLAGGMLADGSA